MQGFRLDLRGGHRCKSVVVMRRILAGKKQYVSDICIGFMPTIILVDVPMSSEVLRMALFIGTFANMNKETLLQVIDSRLKELDMPSKCASILAVGNDALISNMRRERHGMPSIEKLNKLAEVLELELYFGPRRGTVDKSQSPSRSNHEAVALLSDFAFVDRFDVKLSAGPGSNGDNARKLAAVAFRKDWLSERGLRADNCVVCSVGGNSMEPLLHDGDLVLLDRHRRELRNGLVYGITDVEGDVRIKRIERVEQGIILRSDNPECPSELRLGDDANRVKIIGALAWSGHNHNTLKQLPKRTQQPPTFEHEWI